MAQKISQMTEQTTASMTEAGTSDFLGGYTATGGNANRKFSLSGLANYFLNKFKMTLGGSSQTVKSAIDALNSKVSVHTLSGNGSTISFNIIGDSAYGCLPLFGYLPGTGGVALLVVNHNRQMSVKNLLTGADFSSSYYSFEISGITVTITSSINADAKIVALEG